MYTFVKPFISLLLLFLLSFSAVAQKIKATYNSPAGKEVFTGNVFLYLSKDNKSPKDGDVGTSYFPCYRISVKNIKPGQNVLFDDAAVSFPEPLSGIERGDYYVQAVWDKNLGGRAIGN